MTDYIALTPDEQEVIQRVAYALFHQKLPAVALREIGAQFQLGRHDLAALANDMFENSLTPEVQAIWHWDIVQTGVGISDFELNSLLAHLNLWASTE